MTEISDNFFKCIAVNDKLQDSRASHLICNSLFSNHFATNFFILFTNERIFKIIEQLAKLQAKSLIVFRIHLSLSCSKMQSAPDNLCMMDRNAE